MPCGMCRYFIPKGSLGPGYCTWVPPLKDRRYTIAERAALLDPAPGAGWDDCAESCVWYEPKWELVPWDPGHIKTDEELLAEYNREALPGDEQGRHKHPELIGIPSNSTEYKRVYDRVHRDRRRVLNYHNMKRYRAEWTEERKQRHRELCKAWRDRKTGGEQ